MLRGLMINTTREADNHQEFETLTSQAFLSKYHCVVDTADDLMEVANKNVDKFMRERQKGKDYEKELEKAFQLKHDKAPHVSSGASQIVKNTINYLAKPQLGFVPKMDNSYFQFVPSITHKENAIVPLHERITKLQAEHAAYLKAHPKILFTPDVEIPFIRTPHPYEEEIENIKVDWKKSLEEISQLNPTLPPDVDEWTHEFIDKPEQLEGFLEEIKGAKELAVDLEFHAYRSYQGFTCLMQLSTREKDYVLDTIALRSHLHVLNKVFTDPNIVKILHGSKYDIVWLQKDLGIYVVNLFDTGVAAKILGLKASLAFLLKHYCDVTADKKFQLADWRQRPLTEEMSKYARMDTHYLHYIYDTMRLELAQPKNKEDNPINYLKSVFKMSKEIALQIFEKPKAKDSDYFAIVQRNCTLMGEGQLEVLQMLLVWRDYVARVEDESVKYVMPNDVLFDIAKSTPKTSTELEEVLRRHPKHTKHVSILKFEEDLLERINKSVKTCEDKIQKRVNNKKKNSAEFDPLNESSSSDDEEEKKIPRSKKALPNKKIETQKKQSTFSLQNVQIKVDRITKPSNMFANTDNNVERSKQVGRINRFNTQLNMCELMGIQRSQVPQVEKSKKTLESQIQE